jgi:hypothetical protein
MKKSLFILITAITLGLFVASCSKDDDNNQQQNSTVQGTWTGTGQYGTSGGNPTYAFTITFNAGGTVNITGDNSVGVDVATGTWQMVADSVRATYKYASSSAIYVLSGKFTAGATVMAGTIGLDPVTAGIGIFTVTRQQ